jgi:hypothetical protein
MAVLCFAHHCAEGCLGAAMTRLDTALAAIQACHPEHRPQRYFCQSWRDLLKRSGQFHIRKEKGTGEQQGITWYRSLDREEHST